MKQYIIPCFFWGLYMEIWSVASTPNSTNSLISGSFSLSILDELHLILTPQTQSLLETPLSLASLKGERSDLYQRK